MNIEPLSDKRMDEFFTYLNDHISDNGKNNGPLFLPIARDDLTLSRDLIDRFREGLAVPIDTLGWRRAFIAENKENEIIGHIDIKSHNQNYTEHRAVLGMGVHRAYRKQGLGSLLIDSMMDWVRNETEIERIDLNVLSENKAAIGLYVKLGFEKIGEVEDMFRIDGESHTYIMMTINVR